MFQILIRSLFVGAWIVTVLLALLVSFSAVLVFPKAPMWSAVSFLFALPVALVALKSVRTSGVLALFLLTWDVVLTTWPRITLVGLFDSLSDTLLVVVTTLLVFASVVSPYRSVFGPKRQPEPPLFDPFHP